MIRKETITKTVQFLNRVKSELNNAPSKLNVDELERDYSISHTTFYNAKKIGYFIKTKDSYLCTVKLFEPFHARKVIEIDNNRRELRNEPVTDNDAITVKKEKMQIPPSLDEIKSFCTERGSKVNPDLFFSHYEAVNWMIGKNKMTNWKQAISTWEHRSYGGGVVNTSFSLVSVSDADLIAELKRRGYSGMLEIKKEISF